MPEFRHLTQLDHSPEEVFAWHARPGAFERLAPPWGSVRVESRTGGLELGARIRLRLRVGPIPLTWELEHTQLRAGEAFVDEQIDGPFEHWRHEHRFERTPTGGTELLDIVDWGPPLGSIGELLSEARMDDLLRRLFQFRARRLEADLGLIARYGTGQGRRVAITGSTGLVGTALTNQLQAAGYQVCRISRSEGGEGGSETEWVRWDPRAGVLPSEPLEGLFAVVHLAGESIAAVRWTKAKKEAILQSREGGTSLLSRTLAELDRPPEVLVSASAVGYYGNRGQEVLTEESASGQGFLAEVCRRWEASTHLARAVGIRTVHMRTGLVLSTSGGPLQTLLIPFGLGLGGRIGSGRQYLSWIDLDDQTGLITHAICESGTRGALNSTSPNPLTNSAFTDILGRVLRRPTLLPVPAVALSAFLGEMGVELLLSGQRAIPAKAMAAGYEFLYPDLEDSLRHQLGRVEAAHG